MIYSLRVSRFSDNWGICILKIKKFRQVFEQKKAKYNLKNQIKKKLQIYKIQIFRYGGFVIKKKIFSLYLSLSVSIYLSKFYTIIPAFLVWRLTYVLRNVKIAGSNLDE